MQKSESNISNGQHSGTTTKSSIVFWVDRLIIDFPIQIIRWDNLDIVLFILRNSSPVGMYHQSGTGLPHTKSKRLVGGREGNKDLETSDHLSVTVVGGSVKKSKHTFPLPIIVKTKRNGCIMDVKWMYS